MQWFLRAVNCWQKEEEEKDIFIRTQFIGFRCCCVPSTLQQTKYVRIRFRHADQKRTLEHSLSRPYFMLECRSTYIDRRQKLLYGWLVLLAIFLKTIYLDKEVISPTHIMCSMTHDNILPEQNTSWSWKRSLFEIQSDNYMEMGAANRLLNICVRTSSESLDVRLQSTVWETHNKWWWWSHSLWKCDDSWWWCRDKRFNKNCAKL